jgi:hypothetical protein
MLLRNRLFLSFALLCGVILPAACGSGDAASSSGDDVSSTVLPPPSNPAVPFDERTAAAKQVANRGDLITQHAATPIAVTLDGSNPRLVRVRFWGGVAPCNGAHVHADETSDAVVVSLYVGTPPEGKDKMCIDLAELQEVTVELARPLGDRSLHAR